MLFQEYRVTEFVRAITCLAQPLVGVFENCIIGKRAEQLVMAGPGFMNACKNRVDHLQSPGSADALVRHTRAGPNDAVLEGGMLDRPYNRRSNRYDASTVRFRAVDDGCCNV